MKRCFAFVLLTFCMLILSACGKRVSYVEPSEKVLLDAKLFYRQSSLVVFGSCTAATVKKEITFYTIQISEVIAGEVDDSRTIQVTAKSLDVGSGYLLFLVSTDDSDNYKMLNDTALKIKTDSVLWDGTWLSLNTILNELYSFASTITIPGTTYFYTKLKDLTTASDAIFIGKVIESPAISKTKVKSQVDGAIVENTVDASVVRVVVYGSVKGDLKYGTTIRLVNYPSAVSSMIDAISLDAVSLNHSNVMPLSNDSTYMFFIQKTKDVKQDYYFPVNPVQGWISVARDFVTVARFNTPLYGYKTLPLLIRDVRSSLVLTK
ncbi:MAG: hypothetical protein GX802_01880 [Clostridiales bacterium]|nr:hypothetical protein [Clostridiales bacterium]